MVVVALLSVVLVGFVILVTVILVVDCIRYLLDVNATLLNVWGDPRVTGYSCI